MQQVKHLTGLLH